MHTSLLVLVRRLSADREPGEPAGLAALHLDDDTIVISPETQVVGESRPLLLPVKELAGLAIGTSSTVAADAFLLHPLRGVALAVQAREESRQGDLLAIARRVERRAFTLPELTRGLRAVGARRGAPGDDHDRWFGALLAARQHAARADHWSAQLAAFAPEPLRRLLEEAVSALAAVRYPVSPPDQRALAAALEEYASQLDGALDALARADERLRAAGDAERLVAWRAWVETTRQCFAAADRGWLAMAPLLARHAPVSSVQPSPADDARTRTSWWRRGHGTAGGAP